MVNVGIFPAREVIEKAIPNTGERWAVMDRLARSWNFAGKIAPEARSATLKGDGFRLNIGQVEALTFFGDKVRILLASSHHNRLLRSLPIKSANFKSIRGPQSVFTGSVSEYRSARALIDPLHEGYIRSAATTRSGEARRGTPHKASHSMELIVYAKKYASISIPTHGQTSRREPHLLPEEIGGADGTVIEGAKKSLVVNVYERDLSARRKCIAHWQAICAACSLDFAKVYGEDLGKNFIHVHHLRPLHEIGEAYELDPIRDLRPVCPNCHAMLHRMSPPLKIEQLQQILRQQQRLR